MTTPDNNKKSSLYTVGFLIICGGIFLFLWFAPPETTAKLPLDATHKKFYPMTKKEAEKECQNCHNPEGVVFPKGHPPKYRCLFCHKKIDQTAK